MHPEILRQSNTAAFSILAHSSHAEFEDRVFSTSEWPTIGHQLIIRALVATVRFPCDTIPMANGRGVPKKVLMRAIAVCRAESISEECSNLIQ